MKFSAVTGRGMYAMRETTIAMHLIVADDMSCEGVSIYENKISDGYRERTLIEVEEF